jgi:diadenylate cyclase
LHDGAVIIVDNKVRAASCVLPLSASGVLNKTPDRTMGLRHRAALGTSEVSDAISVVVSEETGGISIAHDGHLIRRLNAERLTNLLMAFLLPSSSKSEKNIFRRLFQFIAPPSDENKGDES